METARSSDVPDHTAWYPRRQQVSWRVRSCGLSVRRNNDVSGEHGLNLHGRRISEEISQPLPSHRREIGVLVVTEHSSHPVVSSSLWGHVQRELHRMGWHSFLQLERAGCGLAGCNSFQMFARCVDFNHWILTFITGTLQPLEVRVISVDEGHNKKDLEGSKCKDLLTLTFMTNRATSGFEEKSRWQLLDHCQGKLWQWSWSYYYPTGVTIRHASEVDSYASLIAYGCRQGTRVVTLFRLYISSAA
jgi:hypothetical protein